jgi:hypothetical protein
VYVISSWSADWAVADHGKFEKADDKKKDDTKKANDDGDAPPPEE